MICYDQPGSILWTEDEGGNLPALKLSKLILPMKKKIRVINNDDTDGLLSRQKQNKTTQ